MKKGRGKLCSFNLIIIVDDEVFDYWTAVPLMF